VKLFSQVRVKYVFVLNFKGKLELFFFLNFKSIKSFNFKNTWI